MKITKFLSCAAICLLWIAQSQNLSAQIIKPLAIGDTLPNSTVDDMIKPLAGALTTKSMYSDGMLIISFWATWCKPCIKEMELLAKEVDAHQGKLNVICVSYESKAIVQNFLDKHPDLEASELVVSGSDTLFNKLFFHQALPHNVWINQKGLIKAITGTDEVTSSNISKFMQGQNNNMRVKNEKPFNSKNIAPIPDSVFIYRSIFSKVLPGVELSGSTVAIGKLGRPYLSKFYAYNTRITHLLWEANQMPGLKPNTYLMEVHTSDSSRFFWPGVSFDPKKYKGVSENEWSRNNMYTYEFRSPKALADNVFFPHVISELELYLEVKCRKELKPRKCSVVTYNNKLSLINPASPNSTYFFGMQGRFFVVNNVPIDYFLSMIPVYTFKTFRIEPYLNHTGIKGNISFTVDLGIDPKEYSNIEHWETCLNKQLGLNFEIKEALYPVLIVEDKK